MFADTLQVNSARVCHLNLCLKHLCILHHINELASKKISHGHARSINGKASQEQTILSSVPQAESTQAHVNDNEQRQHYVRKKGGWS